MTKLNFYSLLILLFGGWSTLLDAQVTFKAYLAGRNEVLPVLSRGSGEITATLNGTTLEITGEFKNLSSPVDTNIAGGSHIHRGYTGQNGPVMFSLSPTFDAGMTGGTYEATNNTFSLSAAQVQALEERRFYVNIHTMQYPSGELRGQLLPTVDSYFNTNLFGSNEVPPVLTCANGALSLELNGSMLTVTGSFQNLEGDLATNIAGGAHLHMAVTGQNGGVIIPISATADPDLRGGVFEAINNSFVLDSGQVEALQNRRIYANVHSTTYPSGELRGQVVSAKTTVVFKAHLSGANEPSFVKSRGTGDILVEVQDDTTLLVTGSFQNLSTPLATNIAGGSHIHMAIAGRNGGVVKPINATTDVGLLSGVFNFSDNEFSYTDAQVDALFNRMNYVNVHSESHPSGEIRGQLLPEGQAYFNTFLSSAFSFPEVYSGGTGDVKAELNGNTLTVSGSFDDLGSALAVDIAGGAHIHLGLPGQTGGVIFPLSATTDPDELGGVWHAADNTFTLDSVQIATLKARRYYLNVHSEMNPSGEIRGQLLHQATTYFAAPLSGTSETSTVNSTGKGMILAEINPLQAKLVGSFSDLISPVNTNIAGGAHIHTAMAGRNGGIEFIVNPTIDVGGTSGSFEVADNMISLTSGNVDTMCMRMNYANIHTMEYPSGELRGQFMPFATHYFTSTLSGINEVAINNSGASGKLKFEISGNELTLHGSFSGLESALNTAINGGAHLHLAMPGANGPVSIPINATTDTGDLSGVFAAENNTFILDSAQIAALAEGNFYANIHTTDIPSGEIRGQVLKETNLFPAPETNITAPPSGAMLTIEGDPNTSFTAEWTPGFEPDGNKQVYIWQLAADSAFANIIFQTYTGTVNSFTTDFATVDALLGGAGINVGESITLYHRALGSDGSVQNSGEAGTVTLTRGTFDPTTGVDLNLDITANVMNYTQYVDVTYIITITNEGTETATGVTVAAGLPTGMVHTFNSTDKGDYNLFFETWNVGSLDPGETGTLTLVLFPLIDDMDITNFVQVMTQDQDDTDSTPGNGTCCTANEDDEAVVTVNGPMLPPPGGDTADLALFASVDQDNYDIYEDVTYRLMLINDGPDDAAGINVSAGLPQGMVHTSNSTTTGQYNLFFERWEVGFLAAGDTARLELVLFPLIDDVDITNFFEVLTSDQDDPDSTPGNGVCCTANEDDEAAVTVMPGFAGGDPSDQQALIVNNVLTEAVLYPVPARSDIKLRMLSLEDQPDVHIAILDGTGRMVLLHRTDIMKGVNHWRFDIGHLAAGLYFVRLPDAQILRFVKMQ